MRCKTGDGETWTTVRVKEMRERLCLAEYGGSTRTEETMISLMKAAEPLGPARSGAAEVVRNQGGRIPPRATALLEPAQVTAIRHFAGKLAPPAGFEPAAPGSSTYDFHPCSE
jgi:hypothetical protein